MFKPGKKCMSMEEPLNAERLPAPAGVWMIM